MKIQRRFVIVTLTGVLGVGAAPVQVDGPVTAQEGAPVDGSRVPHDLAHHVDLDDRACPSRYHATPLPQSAYGAEAQDPEPKPPAIEEPPPPRIHEDLERMLSERPPRDRVMVLVNLVDDIEVPQLPEQPYGVDPDSRAARPYVERQNAIIAGLLRVRTATTARFLERLGLPDLRVVRQFWLVNGFVAEVALEDVRALAAQPHVLFVQPNELEHAPGPPRMDAIPFAPVSAARALIGTDLYLKQFTLNKGRIGLIDTGVSPHVLFDPPNDNLAVEGDCAEGGVNCVTPTPLFNPHDCAPDQEGHGHGTAVAAILSGNDNLGEAYRGVTDIAVDSWRVWSLLANTCFPTTAAILGGFEAGLARFDRVFAVELQLEEPSTGIVATAANQAFNAGAVVVAANGNCAVDETCQVRDGDPQPKTVRSPAIAHRVLGIGDFSSVTLLTGDYQGRGPTPDGRVKPDIQAPTDVTTASALGPTILRDRFGGTSAATPFATGAAALLRNFQRRLPGELSAPGLIYARMILSGDRAWDATESYGYSNTYGAGHLRLAACASSHWGAVSLDAAAPNAKTTSSISIKIPVKPWHTSLHAAIWWPESRRTLHDDIDVYWIDPSGQIRAKGYSRQSVFERTEVTGGVEEGSWTLRIKEYKIQSGPQTVYWAAEARGCRRLITDGVACDADVQLPR